MEMKAECCETAVVVCVPQTNYNQSNYIVININGNSESASDAHKDQASGHFSNLRKGAQRKLAPNTHYSEQIQLFFLSLCFHLSSELNLVITLTGTNNTNFVYFMSMESILNIGFCFTLSYNAIHVCICVRNGSAWRRRQCQFEAFAFAQRVSGSLRWP